MIWREPSAAAMGQEGLVTAMVVGVPAHYQAGTAYADQCSSGQQVGVTHRHACYRHQYRYRQRQDNDFGRVERIADEVDDAQAPLALITQVVDVEWRQSETACSLLRNLCAGRLSRIPCA